MKDREPPSSVSDWNALHATSIASCNNPDQIFSPPPIEQTESAIANGGLA